MGGGQVLCSHPVEKIPIVVEKEVFSVIDYKQEGGDYFFQTNTEEWVKLTKKQPLTVEMINHQPYPKIKLREHIYGLLSRNVFYKIISESKQDGKPCILSQMESILLEFVIVFLIKQLNFFFIPPFIEKPPIEPLLPTTLWHGTSMG